ncbi:MAG: COR domain-containing protein, partial [Bacteroidota bacterium]
QLDEFKWGSIGYVLNTDNRVEALCFFHRKIKRLPTDLYQLTELKSLDLSFTGLESAEELENLEKLQELNLYNNQIEAIPFCKSLPSLKILHLLHNPLTDFSPLLHLENLDTLSITQNEQLKAEVLSSLSKLKRLNIQLTSHLEQGFLMGCKGIKQLGVFSEKPRTENSVPDEVFEYLRNSQVEDLRLIFFSSVDLEEIAKLSRLRSLSIERGFLKNLMPLSNLRQLRFLSLKKNEMSDITFLVEQTHLESLNLAQNQIENITPLAKLTALKFLNLSYNPITDLRPLLKHQMKFNINGVQDGTPEGEIVIAGCDKITNPPMEIVKQGDAAIRRYFEKIADEGIEYIFEAKLILVGEGSAGKTSLQKRLLDEAAELPANDKRTRGIEVKDYVFEQEADNPKIAHIWDFGGQDVYYPVHRFFITENSVFVLLASTRQTNHNFDYWIPTIYQFGGKSPIIIGQTCHDGNTAPWNDIDVYMGNSEFKIIRTQDQPFYQLDLPKENEGLSAIRECITHQIKRLPHFGKGVPRSWLTIRKRLLEKSENESCIPFHSFIELCRAAAPDSFEELQDIRSCCQFFHDIGVVLWYSAIEDLCDWVVLQPDWAMNAVYKIIDDAAIQERKGHILAEDFQRLWCERSFESKHNVLKKMLGNFKIAFSKRHAPQEYIIPARLSSIPKAARWPLESKSLRLEYNFEFMPRGIVNQISSELSRHIRADEVWNNAVNLTYDNDYTECQIIEDSYNRVVTIDSRGVDARGMNMLVMNSIDNIIDGYKGVRANIEIKCICDTCQEMEDPQTFSYNKLLKWMKVKREPIAYCNESGEPLQIYDLLYHNGLLSDQYKQIRPQKRRTVSIFLASSDELKEDRRAFEIFINRENKELNESNIFLRLENWEDGNDKMSNTRLQDEYNKKVAASDIFLGLFWSKVGKYSREEFQTAHAHFAQHGKPAIYTYFKNEPIAPGKVDQSLTDFNEELSGLGHFVTNYESAADLERQFKRQLSRFIKESL